MSRLTNRRRALAIAVSAAIILGVEVRFPGDCGDTAAGWTCDTAGALASYGFLASASLLAVLLAVALWRFGRSLARRMGPGA